MLSETIAPQAIFHRRFPASMSHNNLGAIYLGAYYQDYSFNINTHLSISSGIMRRRPALRKLFSKMVLPALMSIQLVYPNCIC